MPETYTYFEVRVPNEYFEFSTEPAVTLKGEVNYDSRDLESAKAYAQTLVGGYVVKITVEKV